MKEHGDNGSTTTARGLPTSPHISSSDKLIRDQELQHLVTSSIPSPPYGGLSLINASAALVFGADPIYSTHLFASLANNPTARFQLPLPIPLALQTAPANHPAHQNPLHHQHHQRNIFHHLPAAAVPTFASLPGATMPNVTQLDILSSWVNEQASRTAASAAAAAMPTEERKITSTTSTTPPSGGNTPSKSRKNSGSNKNNRKKSNNDSQVKNKNKKNLNSSDVIKLSKRSVNGATHLAVTKANRKNKSGRNLNLNEGIVSSSENDVVIKKDEFEKDVEPMNFELKPFIVDTSPVGNTIQKMEIDHSPFPKGGKAIVVEHNVSHGSPSPTKIHSNNNNNSNHDNNNKKVQGQTSPGQNGTRDKVFTCPTCNRCFGYKHVLQNHERTHTGEKPFECSICMKKFTRDHHLKTHMRLHTGEKPYQCTHCDRQFVQVANLRRHVRVHTGERPYSCDICAAKFSDSNQLKAHMLIHKDTSPPQLLTPTSVVGRDRGERVVPELTGKERRGGNGKRERKSRETRRIIRLEGLPMAATVTTSSNSPLKYRPGSSGEPEQDLPEDLSMSGSTQRSRNYSGSSSSITASSSPSPRSGLMMMNQLVRPYCNSSSEETPDLFSDEDLRAADSSTNGKNESSSEDISSLSHHE